LVRTRTAFAIPLIRDRIELGVLTLSHSEPYRFSAEQFPIVLAVATQVISALHNANLYTQLREAEAAREYFVHMLTHDLRGPLAGVLGCLHVLGTSIKSEADLQFIEMARRACGAQEELISDILDVYRAESGRLELTREQLVPTTLRERVLDQLAGAAAERHINLTIDVPDELQIVADVDKLIRVIINLVNNAIKFTRKGSVHVTAAYTVDQTQVQFTVQDTGVGIAPEDVAHIFDRFFRSRQTTPRRGSGLGLDFCREVVQAHGGMIWAESQVNSGTTIHFTIPREGKHHEQMALTGR
jgi:signal transduction histidine kinase